MVVRRTSWCITFDEAHHEDAMVVRETSSRNGFGSVRCLWVMICYSTTAAKRGVELRNGMSVERERERERERVKEGVFHSSCRPRGLHLKRRGESERRGGGERESSEIFVAKRNRTPVLKATTTDAQRAETVTPLTSLLRV